MIGYNTLFVCSGTGVREPPSGDGCSIHVHRSHWMWLFSSLRPGIRYRPKLCDGRPWASTRYNGLFHLSFCRYTKGMRAVKLHQQNPLVLNWRCQLTQVDLYNGRKTVVVLYFYCYKLTHPDNMMQKNVKVAPTRVPSIGFRSDPGSWQSASR